VRAPRAGKAAMIGHGAFPPVAAAWADLSGRVSRLFSPTDPAVVAPRTRTSQVVFAAAVVDPVAAVVRGVWILVESGPRDLTIRNLIPPVGQKQAAAPERGGRFALWGAP
jgi:hypothetical protein